MGRQRPGKKQKGNAEEGADDQPQYEHREQGPDPNFRLIAVHGSLCAVAIGAHLRVIDYNSSTVQQIDIPASETDQQSSSVRALAFSPDSHYLLSGGDDKTVRIWSTKDWSCIATFKAPKKISAAAFTQDSNHALFADKFGDVLACKVSPTASDAEAPAPSLLLGHLNAIITSITISPDNKFVVSTDKDAKVRVSILPSQPLKGSYEVQSYCLGHTQFVTSAAFVKGPSDGYLLVTGSGDGTVRLWDPLTGDCLDKYIASAEQEQPADADEQMQQEPAATDAADAAAADQQQAAGEDEDDQDAQEEQAGSSCAAVFCVAASADGSTIAAAVEGESGVLLLSCDHQQRKLALSQKLELPSVAHPCSAAFDSTGRLWVAGGVPLQSSKTVHVAVAQRSGEGGSGEFVVCSEVVSEAGLAALECRDPQEEQQLEGGALLSYYSHLKKRTYDPEEMESRKKQRNDRKESNRLAQLRGDDS